MTANTAVADAYETKALETRLEETRGVVKKAERDLGKAERRLADAKDRLRKITERRSTLLLAARNGNAEAQAEIDKMEKERQPLERDIRDDEECIARLSEYLNRFRAQLSSAERELERRQLLQKLHARMDGGKEVELMRTLDRVKELWEEILRQDAEACDAIRAFDPDLKREIRIVERMHSVRSELIGAELHRITPTNLSGSYLQVLSKNDLGSYLGRTIGDLISTIECLDLAS